MFLLPVAAACGSGNGSTPTATATPEPAATPTIDLPPGSVPTEWIDVNQLVYQEDSALERTLSNLTGDRRFLNYLAINDITAVANKMGLTPPEPSEDAEAGLEYAINLFLGTGEQSNPAFSGVLPIFADLFWLEQSQLPYWGFDWRNYRAAAVARAGGDTSSSIIGEYEAIIGDFDFELIKASIAACEECVEPTVGTLLEQPYLRWKGHSAEERKSPPFFHLGFSGHFITVQNGVLYRARNEESLRQALEASSGEANTLADDADAVSLVRAIGALGADGALISFASFALDDLWDGRGNRDELVAAAQTADLLRPFTAVGAGAGTNGSGRFTALVLLNQDAPTAKENVTLLVDRIQNGMTDEDSSWADLIDRVEIGIDSNLVVARLYHSITGLTYIAQHPNANRILTISE